MGISKGVHGDFKRAYMLPYPTICNWTTNFIVIKQSFEPVAQIRDLYIH